MLAPVSSLMVTDRSGRFIARNYLWGVVQYRSMGEGDVPETLSAPKKTLAIVTALAEAGEPMRVSELATELSTSKSTAYKHLATLSEQELVVKEGVKYRLTMKFAEYGEHVKADSDLYWAAKPHVDKLVETTTENVGLAIKHGLEVVDVYQAGDDPDVSSVNSRYCHCSAPGKAILSQLPEARLREVVTELPLVARTEHTITDPDELLEELAKVRERGIAFERREQRPDVRGLAVPFVFGDEVAAVYVSGHADRLASKRFEEDIPGMVLGSVRRIQEKADES